MKTTSLKMLLLPILCLLIFAPRLYAQTQIEQLKQMVAQLQTTPSDSALREKIIKLAVTIKPAPAIPDEAITNEGRAKFAFRNAKSTDDYLDAAKEYEKALQAAPWIPGYYTDLCTIYEKAGKCTDAKRHCETYLKTLTDPSQISETKQRIAGLDYGIEKAAADAEKAAAVAKVTAVKPAGPDFSGKWVWIVAQGFVAFGIEKDGDTWIIRDRPGEPFENILSNVKVQGRQIWGDTRYYKYHFILSEDSQTIEVVTTKSNGDEFKDTMKRK